MRGSTPGIRHRQVAANIPMLLVTGPGGVAVSADLLYTTHDPLAVRATFHRRGHSPVVWTFARDLLLAGVTQATGLGDVQVFPRGKATVLRLTSPEGTARLEAPTMDLKRFAARILSLVPAGAESDFIDIDTELAALDPALFPAGNN
jgi:hypothetical protein